MIIRITSPKGCKRVTIEPHDSISKLYEQVASAFCLKEGDDWTLSKSRSPSQQIQRSLLSLKTLNLQNGDSLFLLGGAVSNLTSPVGSRPESEMAVDRGETAAVVTQHLAEDDIDQQLDKLDGRIVRNRHPQFCHHGQDGKCIHCIPLEPYDETYLLENDPPIKFLSFHSYLRKLRNGSSGGKYVYLEDIDCKLKLGCKEHPPWPEGICTKCSPNPVTLSIQKFRHVDHVEFENADMCDKFLDYWRNTGKQRIGFLYGRYELYDKVPLGIKAKVCCIYEPPQICTAKSIRLEQLSDDTIEKCLSRVTQGLGLECVGWIFTDLVPLDKSAGTVKHFRGTSETHFLSAQECITAAYFQNMRPNRCKWTSQGIYGSKFVTVVVTGDADNNIHFESYQVSNQCMSLVRDKCLVPTKDRPELGYIRESTNQSFVPDVFYTANDKYGNASTRLARPLPVEYLLTHMPASVPVQGEYTFTPSSLSAYPFPIEHRQDTGEVQEFALFAHYLKSFSPDHFLESLSNFHVLLFLASCDVFPLESQLDNILLAVKNKDRILAMQFSHTDEWQTVMRLVEHADDMILPMGGGSGSSAKGHAVAGSSMHQWVCPRCTLVNNANTPTCAACSFQV